MFDRWYYFKRRLRLLFQRWTRGWDDSDTWSLNTVLATFALPRLRRYKELSNGYPVGMTEAEWNTALDDMIYAMSLHCVEPLTWDDVDHERLARGCALFGTRFRDLWW